MRVTNKMLSNSFLNDMRNNLENMQTLQQQMTSGKEIRKPSDDPFKAARIMQLTTDVNSNKQYNDNIQDVTNWLNTTDTSLGQAGDVLQRVRELLVSAGDAAYGSDEQKGIKDEINQKIDEFAQILNGNFDGKYVFGGTRGTAKPLTTTVDSSGNTQLAYYSNDPANPVLNVTNPPNADGNPEFGKIDRKLSIEISQGVTIDYNVSANELVQFNASVPDSNGKSKEVQYDLRQLFSNITNHLDGKDDSGNPDPTGSSKSKLTQDDLQGITDAISNLLKVRAEVGAKQNRMDSAKQKNIDENSNMTEILSKTEDIDITQKTMEYATMQTVYMASLQTSARVIQPSLLDYLR